MTARVDKRDTPTTARGSFGNALSAMYVLATVAMGLGFLVIVGLMFVPSDWREMFEDPSEVYVPGSVEGFSTETAAGPLREAPGVTRVEHLKFRAVLVAYNWEFEPKEIRVPVGAEVEFAARSGQEYHGIALMGTSIAFPLATNEVTEFTHVFDEAGEYTWVCSQYCGSGHANMYGTVIVE